MSAAFKNSKRKLSQTELRKLMNEHKNKVKVVPKINSPLAKYNDLGQLVCILCQSVVRSEAVWPIHINSKQHKDKVETAKKLKEKTNNFTTPLKRPLTPPLPQSSSVKKLKGILKNSSAPSTEVEVSDTANGVPEDFFDAVPKAGLGLRNRFAKQAAKELQDKEASAEKMEVSHESTAPIPEGFFDDPKQDAKARNMDYKDPIEEEWEKFQKVIRDADNESATIIAEDQHEATNERQIDEVEEQMKNLSRVLTLEKKKNEIVSTKSNEMQNDENEDSSESEVEFDEFLDWRSKKSYKR